MFFFCKGVDHNLGLVMYVSCTGASIHAVHGVWLMELCECGFTYLKKACFMPDSCLYLESLALAICYEYYLSANVDYSLEKEI